MSHHLLFLSNLDFEQQQSYFVIMGQCFSTAVQQVVTVLQQPQSTDNDNNAPSSSTQPSHTTAPTTTHATAPSHTTTSTTSSKLSPIYTSLPNDAELIQVRNVYDGDTMTLTDERRIRLLGIDTPEIKQQQPYAQESKQYTKHLIDTHAGKIYLSYEPNQDRQDHYGRLLGFVYVQQGPQQYLCINEGLVQSGYATVYAPNKASQIQAFPKYTQLQKEAQTQRRGVWTNFIDRTVYKTSNGSAYHEKSCEHLRASHNVMEVKVSFATTQGLHPCRTCCTSGAA
jgi:endonuclease YncB( thermonuclease family)